MTETKSPAISNTVFVPPFVTFVTFVFTLRMSPWLIHEDKGNGRNEDAGCTAAMGRGRMRAYSSSGNGSR